MRPLLHLVFVFDCWAHCAVKKKDRKKNRKKRKTARKPFKFCLQAPHCTDLPMYFPPCVLFRKSSQNEKGELVCIRPAIFLYSFLRLFLFSILTCALTEFSEKWGAVRAKTTRLTPGWWMYLCRSYQKCLFFSLEHCSEAQDQASLFTLSPFWVYGWGQCSPTASWVKWPLFFLFQELWIKAGWEVWEKNIS